MDVSVIIPTLARPALLLDTIQSILRGRTLPAEIIVVDQGQAPLPALAAFQSPAGCVVRYLWSPPAGVSRARNEGIRAARQAKLVFTDDDVLVSPTWLENLVGALQAHGPRSVVTGQVQPAGSAVPGRGQAGFVPSTKVAAAAAVYAGYLEEDVLYSNNMAMYRAVFDEVGLFDERLGAGTPFRGAEDNDLGFRLLAAHYRIVYVPEAEVVHRAWRSAGQYLPLRWDYGVGRGAYYAKHLGAHRRQMLGRFRRDLARLQALPARWPRARQQAQGDVMLVSGMLYGAARWLLTRHPARAK